MKKVVKSILAVSSAVMMGFAFGACKTDKESNYDEDIHAVYQSYVAYAEGNNQSVLSYEDWLESIKGETGATGPKGENGNTPYIGTNGNWFIGEQDTGVKAEGADGTDGSNGADGVTPHIGDNGNWFIGEQDTGIKAEGTNGTNGSNGSDGVTPHIGDNGNWFIGEQDTGVKAEGTNGTDGKDGIDGKTPTITISQDGYWVINDEKSDVVATGTAPVVTIGADGYWYINGEKQSIKAEGVMGTVWYTGRGIPTDTKNGADLSNSKAGDFYVNTNTNTIYILGSDAKWSVLVNVNEQNNLSVWDGTIPGWQNPTLSDADIIKNRPVSYVVDDETKTVDIYNAEAFAWFAYRSVIGKTGYAGWTVTLHCDIDLNNQIWIPIGLGARSNAAGVAFQGTFDGNGHTIYNLSSEKFYEGIKYGEFENLLSTAADKTETGWYINVQNEYLGNHVNVDVGLQFKDNEMKEADEFSFGLFGSAYNATIKNLNIENVKIDLPEKTVNGRSCVGDSTGAIVGFAQYNLVLDNCRVGYEGCEGTITGAKCAGGLLGRFYGGKDGDGKVQTVNGVQTYDKAYYGSLTITNCVNYLGVGVAGIDKKAGIVGYPGYFSALTIDNCANYGAITGQYAGGILGFRGNGTNPARGSVTVSNCTNYGKITGTYAGGILGERNATGGSGNNPFFIFRNCNNFGEIVGTSFGTNAKIYAGGLIGSMTIKTASGLLLDCFNYGNITVEDSSEKLTEVYAGGIFGNFEVGANISFVISAGNSGDVTVNSTSTVYADTDFGKKTLGTGAELNLPYGNIINTGSCTENN